MARVEGEIIIHRPIETVFDFVADETNEPKYNPNMVHAERISDGPIGKGTRFVTELKRMGRTMVMTVEFTRFERPRLLASTTRSSAMLTEGELTFEPVDGGTRMRWSWDVRPRRRGQADHAADRLARATSGARDLGRAQTPARIAGGRIRRASRWLR